jgi:predicted CXXCH cytochrome family protein
MPLRRVLPAALIVLSLAAAASAWWLFSRHEPPPAAQFVGTSKCAGCHQQAFEDWQQSHHRHAMEVPDQDSVLGDFSDVRFDYFGTSSRFFMRDGQYFVETDDAQGRTATFRVAYTFGWQPLQQYLIEFPDGRLQALSISWDSRPAAEGGQRWFHLYPDRHVDQEDPLHWTGAFQNWNSRCAACHSTGLVRDYSMQENRYSTRWKDLNVGCEACHGPGSRHLAWAGGDGEHENRGLVVGIDALWEPVDGRRPAIPQVAPGMSAQLQACSACHARRGELRQPDPAGDFLDNYTLSALAEGLYHADGQILDEVYETGSFMQSLMHQNHVSCTNCHEPHGGRLRATGNDLCLQCHEPPKYQTPAHFFHEPQSPGAQCVNCHMPQQTYMGIDARRDHSFRVPDPIASVRLGVPNACTQCHRDRDDHWAAQVITQRTGRTEPRYAHASLLTAARRHDPASLPALLDYAANEAQPSILRATALQESARFPSQTQLQAATGALGAADPLLRAAAAQALGQVDALRRFTLLRPLLADPVKSVRIAAARQLTEVRPPQVPDADRPALTALFAEYRAALLHNADLPESMSDLGVFLAAQGDLAGAEQALLHARRIAPYFLPALLNLADIHRARGRDDLAEPLLREAVQRYPESGDARHMLGLLHVRTGRTADSVALFEQASRLAPGNPQYALVHAVALIETGDRDQGIAVLEAALRRFPGNAALEQALAGFRATP